MPAIAPVTRLSLKNILLPTDFSPASRAALPFVRALARIYESTVLVAHSIAPEPHLQVVLDRVPAQDDRVREDAQHKLGDFAHTPLLQGTACKTLLDRGDLADVIPAMIQEQQVGLVVLGTHGRRGMSKLVLGSQAEKIYRSAPCPVLTVGPRVHASSDWKLRRILCPVDVAENSEPVLHYALSLAEENQSEFIVLEAVPLVPWQFRTSVEEHSRRAMEHLIPEAVKDWCTPQYVTSWEHPGDAIVHTAEERGADLIVMSVRKSRVSSWSVHLPWPIASEVVSRAPCPVLTIRV